MGLTEESPFCVAVLSFDRKDGKTEYKLEQVNSTFVASVAPLFKIQESLKEKSFAQVLTANKEHQTVLENAIEEVAVNPKPARARAQSIEVLTLAEEDQGFPIKRHFDWLVSKSTPGQIVLYGDRCHQQDIEQRAQDAELVDFFNNAPIALHWLSGEGIVLWANKRELEVLGYTEEEYIGQPIMKFCPDEEELVLEIFKQLGSGNTIKDVPVRFRTKEGKIVNLLIDSNVKYDEYGKFAHTRCFIRDDTGRKIHEAKAQLLLEETKRSLKMLDNFMSRSLHHVRTPLHILQNSMDLIQDQVQTMKRFASEEKVSTKFQEAIQESEVLLTDATEQIQNSVVLLDDISDLAKLDQQQELKLNKELVDIKTIGREVFGMIDIPDDVDAALEFHGGGSTHLNTDKHYLMKVLRHLLDHCANGQDAQYNFSDQEHRHISLFVGNKGDVCQFQVVVSVDSDLPSGDMTKLLGGEKPGTDLPPIFQKYHQELLPDEIRDVAAAGGLRSKIEASINSQRFDSLNIGLSLSYHLVAALGGDLRYSSESTRNCFSFGIPHSSTELSVERIVFKSKTKSKNKFAKVPEIKPAESPKQDIVSRGVKAFEPPSVLVVEDVPMCAKLLLKQLNRLNCSTKWAENGQVAVDIIKETNPGVYDLILMDIRMPIMDGIEATRILKKELGCTTPIIALTGEVGEDIREQCKALSFDGFRNKPLKRDALLSILNEHLGYTAPTGPSQ
ncbi:Autoinducer 1 sensor kinase/phosphatase LuxN [Seminavis robusta]|uniref:histidine kinase n=1 Tax=Seminavis robusta TaxID=568900 RepID=A0A9N8DU86_9STRA|nr:Autoinducer 1 sensor kinase/phosphatase LuxN [Seminavis robusta]|eukprot:Sro347_g122970.1 Autoinducer 1 sensor kinase/phosphatase LuxN (728) ;mRNA; f:45070-47253